MKKFWKLDSTYWSLEEKYEYGVILFKGHNAQSTTYVTTRPFCGYCTLQVNLRSPATSVKNCRTLTEQNYTGCMLLLMATSSAVLGRTLWSSPPLCYLQCLCTNTVNYFNHRITSNKLTTEWVHLYKHRSQVSFSGTMSLRYLRKLDEKSVKNGLNYQTSIS